MEKVLSFKIIGIGINTTNKDGKSGDDLNKLWKQFYAENISEKITNKLGHEVYSVYTDYESDYTGNYKVVIGLKVDSLDRIPNGLIGMEIKGGKYLKFIAKGRMPNAVLETWQKIWEKDKELNRSYSADFEVYGEYSQNEDNSKVDIYIAIN
ncbi:MAG: GyrI-like domain-containing protein [Candidatus Saccharimonadaceae bacterium]